jgi:hypothetical protein
MLKHEKRVKNPQRKQLLRKATKRFINDGLNSVNYTLVRIDKYKMFTHILIDVGEPPVELLKAIEELIAQSNNKNKKENLPATTKLKGQTQRSTNSTPKTGTSTTITSSIKIQTTRVAHNTVKIRNNEK